MHLHLMIDIMCILRVTFLTNISRAFVVQLDRITGFDPVGCGFESYQAYHFLLKTLKNKGFQLTLLFFDANSVSNGILILLK